MRPDPQSASAVIGAPRPSMRARASPRLFDHLGGWTVWLACSMILSLLALQLVNDWLNRDLSTLHDRRAGTSVPDSEIALNHHRLLLFGKMAIALLAVTGFLWLCWQFQAHANLRALGPSRTLFGPVTGLMAWAIPVLDLVLVPLAVGELWLKSDPWDGTPDHSSRWSLLLVLVWWGLFLTAAGLAANGFRHASANGSGLSGLIARDELLKNAIFVGLGAAAAAAAVTVLIHLRLEGKEARLAA